MGESIEAKIRQRARHCCEYCRMPDDCDPLPFQLDHIIAKQHGGSSSFDNLALSCLACNNHKGPNIAGIDPEGYSQEVVRLFHPRNDRWDDHFEWDGATVRGTTAIGRVTVYVLGMNLAHRVSLRRSLLEEGAFPPT